MYWVLSMLSWVDFVFVLCSGRDILRNICIFFERVYKCCGRRDFLRLLGFWDGFKEKVGRRVC